jgi:hypothetical protein
LIQARVEGERLAIDWDARVTRPVVRAVYALVSIALRGCVSDIAFTIGAVHVEGSVSRIELRAVRRRIRAAVIEGAQRSTRATYTNGNYGDDAGEFHVFSDTKVAPIFKRTSFRSLFTDVSKKEVLS